MGVAGFAFCNLALLMVMVVGRKLNKRPKIDTSMIINPDPAAVDTKIEQYGGNLEGDIKGKTGNQAEDRNALSEDSVWEDGLLPYEIADDVDDNLREKIMLAIADFHSLTCVKWEPRKSERGFVKFQKTEPGCWAHMGYTGSEQAVNLQGDGCNYKGTILHEMLHAVGFGHEQSRNDRDDYIDINWENVQDGNEDQFEKLTMDEENNLGQGYDFSSVLHYGPYAFSKNGKQTINTINPKHQDKIGQRAGFSPQDVKEVNLLYKCDTKNKNKKERIGKDSSSSHHTSSYSSQSYNDYDYDDDDDDADYGSYADYYDDDDDDDDDFDFFIKK